ncbi:MAG TPA: MBOAT family protein [Chthoniobacterales bacterium]|nr:MBOAT family protein [Chthoniobacterales bacterium]
MVFSSHIFIFYFLPLALLGYYALAGAPQRWRNFWLIITGYIFYGWAEPRFMLLMFATTSIDWLMSLVIAHDDWRVWRFWNVGGALVPRSPLGNGEVGALKPLPRSGQRSRTQRTAITASIISNLVVLGFFKYFNFGVDSYNAAVQAVGFDHAQWDTFFRVVLPLGISFYTFQALSYTIDVYRGEAEAMANFIDFSCFVSMFPHLVAGPILKFSFLAGQLKHRTLTREKFARGVAFFMFGLAKKILLANPCGKIADTAFDAGSVGTLDAWFGSIAYAFQIYFDFSGYSDMAIGLGLMLGFVFAKNFDSPYRAESLTDFWRRWHISLSTWLREYLYIPLGGNRGTLPRTYANLVVTMLLGGLWHGASWNFVIWGGMHGGMLAFERSQGRESFYHNLPKPLRVAVTFLIVLLAWVFFRAADLPRAITYLASMFGLGDAQPGAVLIAGIIYQPYFLLSLGAAAVVVWAGRQTWDWTQQMTLPKTATCFACGWLALVVLATQEYNPFIYFIF